jgi:Domain of unknown function (DUF5659)
MDEKNIRTSDLYFAAYLQSVGCKIVNIDKDGTKNLFTFADDQNRKSLKEDYFNEAKGSEVPALKLANSIRSLKTLCYVKN